MWPHLPGLPHPYLHTEGSGGQLPYLSSEGSLFCLVAVLSCDSNRGGKVFPHILEIDGRWGDHHICVCGKKKEGAHSKLAATKSFTMPTNYTTQALSLPNVSSHGTVLVWFLMLPSHQPKPIIPWSIISKRTNNTSC